jgi:hypothetical protein
MDYVLASSGLADWGQLAAIILALYLFLSIVVGLALAAGLMLGFAWIREKAELLRRVHPLLTQVNQAVATAKRGEPLPREIEDNKILASVVQAPVQVKNIEVRAGNIEQKIEQGSDRVADVVIELRARTAMVKGMAKAFFLPGLTRRVPRAHVVQTIKEQQVLPEERSEEVQRQEPERPLEKEMVIVQSSR